MQYTYYNAILHELILHIIWYIEDVSLDRVYTRPYNIVGIVHIVTTLLMSHHIKKLVANFPECTGFCG